MAVWSVIDLSAAQEHDRFSAEYWRPEYLEPLKHRVPWTPLGHVLKRVQYGLSREMHEDEIGVPCFRMNEMDSMFLSTPKKFMVVDTKEHKQYRLNRGDVLFNRTNSLRFVGRTGYCDRDTDSVFASYLIRLDPDTTKLLPEYLVVYLNTDTGVGQVKRRAMESINQANVSGSEVKLVPIPLFPISMQEKVAAVFHRASQERADAERLYAEAEELMESALGLDKLNLTPQLFYERPYVEVQTTARFDAEYFQPRMQNLIKTLSRDGQTINDVAKLSKRRFKPKAGTKFNYIEIGDVSGKGTADSNLIEGEDAPSRAAWYIKPGDIITTTVRPIRRLSALIIDEQTDFVCSSGFAVLTPREPNDMAPELLLVYLRLPLVCELLDLHTTASMYPAISTIDMMKIPITLPKDAVRHHIVTKVRASFDAQRAAQRLLGEAKAMVEEAILKNNYRI